jgi:tetratricopeptide (TPR) repeat protein
MSKERTRKSAGGQLRCPSCGTPSDASDRFCRKCGAALSPDARTNGGRRGLPGLRAFGLALVALAAIYAFLQYGKGGAGTDAVPSQRISITDIEAGTAGAPATLSPRAAADELFNHAMAAYETGDDATARRSIPMAIAAYEDLDMLDLDARYHLALLMLAAEQPEDALAQADTILAEVPEHLLGLSAAAQSYDRLGRMELAVEFFQRFLDAYTPDAAASRPEYIDHGRALPARRETARAYLQEHGRALGGS